MASKQGIFNTVTFCITLSLLVSSQVQGQCSDDSSLCVCIPNVRKQCADSFINITLQWDSLLSVGSTSVVDVVPGSFAQGQGITTIELSDNPTIMLVNGSFSGLNNLLSLNMRGNGLVSLPDGLFTDTPNLQHLDLSSNQLTSVNPLAFTGLTQLQTLTLSSNQLSIFPPEELLSLIQQLNALYLYPNPIDCTNSSLDNLLSLVSAGVVSDSSLLRCSNGTLIDDMLPSITQPTASSISTSTTYLVIPSVPIVTSTSTNMISPSRSAVYDNDLVTSSSLIVLPTPTTVVVRPTETPRPVYMYCAAETTLTMSGYLDWPTSLGVSTITLECPSNRNALASRVCELNGWGPVNRSLCDTGSDIVLLLYSISQISPNNIVDISSQLSFAVQGLQLTEREVIGVLDVIEQLIMTGATNIIVLNNTLGSLDSILASNVLLTRNTQQIRSLLDSALLEALSVNQTQIILAYSHLVLGGAYISASNESAVLAVIRLHNDGLELEFNSTGDGNITVNIEGGSGAVQVTVYEDDGLFNQSNCSSSSSNVITPVVSITNELSDSNEVVIVNFHLSQGTSGHTLLCVRWIVVDCGGEWSSIDCALVTSSTGTLQCRCLHEGSYAVLDVPDDLFQDKLYSTYKIVFHVMVSMSVPLYLVITIVILSARPLRTLATMQATALLSVVQPLYLLSLQLSVHYPNWLCYTFAMSTHYFSLVSLSLLIVIPVLEVIRIFRMILFEKIWLIVPFALICFVWPSIPIGVYAGLRYSDFTPQLRMCWLELVTFPNTLTYINAAVALTILLTVLTTLILLACSDYTIESDVYFRVLIGLVNAILFCGLLTIHFFTGSSSGVTQDQLLIAIAATAFLCGLWHFVSHGVLQSNIRSVLACKQDPALKRKLGHPRSQPDSGFQSRNSPLRNRRHQIKLQEDFNYIDDYLGYPVNNPVPLGMLKGDRIQHRKSEQLTSNPLYNDTITLTDDY